MFGKIICYSRLLLLLKLILNLEVSFLAVKGTIMNCDE